MDRFWQSGASAGAPAIPAPGSTGFPISGNAGTGTPPTKPGPYWYHQITEELRKLIVDAGLAPDPANLTQVSQAVQRMAAAQTGAIASGRNLAARTNAVTPNTKVDLSADEFVLKDVNGNTFLAKAIIVTVDFGTVGANGIDAGALAASTWYYVWVIAKPDGTIAGLGSTSSAAPTMPAGYVFKAMITAARSDASTHFVPYRQFGAVAYFQSRQSVLSAGAATVETSVSVASFVPPIALSYRLNVDLAQGTVSPSTNNLTATVRYVSGSDFYKLTVRGDTTYAGNESAEIELPNVSQTFYYLLNNGNGSPTADALITAFRMPGGGE